MRLRGPTGITALIWLIEKFHTWSNCAADANTDDCFTKDELLTNIVIYWVTQTINSSIRAYYGGMHPQEGEWGQVQKRIEVSIRMALFPKDNPPPHALAERYFDVQCWTKMPQGGHFAALEQPELLVEDLREFFRPLRSGKQARQLGVPHRQRRTIRIGRSSLVFNPYNPPNLFRF